MGMVATNLAYRGARVWLETDDPTLAHVIEREARIGDVMLKQVKENKANDRKSQTRAG